MAVPADRAAAGSLGILRRVSDEIGIEKLSWVIVPYFLLCLNFAKRNFRV